MALSSIFGWRTPEGTAQPVVHVDMANLAADIEATVSKTRRLVAGFPKDAGPATVSGWVVSNLTVYKWQLGTNHFEYEFTGYIGRSSSFTIPAGAGAEIAIANILDTDVNIDGGPAGVPANYMMCTIQGGGSMYNGVQVEMVGRDLRIRSTGSVAMASTQNIAVNGYKAYSTV